MLNLFWSKLHFYKKNPFILLMNDICIIIIKLESNILKVLYILDFILFLQNYFLIYIYFSQHHQNIFCHHFMCLKINFIYYFLNVIIVILGHKVFKVANRTIF